MLYETAARAAEVLGLDVPGLDMPNRRVGRADRLLHAIQEAICHVGPADDQP